VIQLNPQHTYLNQSDFSSELSVGSFGLLKGIVNMNHGSEKHSMRVVHSNTHSDGYRDNNTYDRQTLTLSSNHFLNPTNRLSFLASYVDARSRLLGTSKVFQKKLSWTFGGEFFRDRYTYKTFENLYRDFPEDTGSVQGNLLSDFQETRHYYNVFAETNFEASPKTTISFGLNLNQTAYDLDDNFLVSDDNPDQSGQFKFKSIVSPKLGVSHLFSKNLSVFSSISHGFSPLSLEEALLPDGQINTNLKPETGWNFEMGARGASSNNKLHYNISIYRLDIKNLLVSRRTAQDEFIGINAGRTQHDGLELALNYNWIQNKNLSINWLK